MQWFKDKEQLQMIMRKIFEGTPRFTVGEATAFSVASEPSFLS